MARNDSMILILQSVLGPPNPQAKIQRRAYYQPDSTNHGINLSLIVG